jgi:hypothetical protein
MAGDIEEVAELIRSGELVRAAERAGARPLA